MIQLLSIVKKATCNFCSQRVEAGSDLGGLNFTQEGACLPGSTGIYGWPWWQGPEERQGVMWSFFDKYIIHAGFYVLCLQPVSLRDILWIEASHKIEPPGRKTWAQPRHSWLCCCSAGVWSNLSTRDASASAVKWFVELRLEAPSDYSEAPAVVPATIFVIEVCEAWTMLRAFVLWVLFELFLSLLTPWRTQRSLQCGLLPQASETLDRAARCCKFLWFSVIFFSPWRSCGHYDPCWGLWSSHLQSLFLNAIRNYNPSEGR